MGTLNNPKKLRDAMTSNINLDLVQYMSTLSEIIEELKRIKKDEVELSHSELKLFISLADLFDSMSDEIRFMVRKVTRH